jgi:hypothetical protein
MAVLNYDWHDQIYFLGSCPEAITWARPYSSYNGAWLACPKGHWLIWLLARMAIDGELAARKQLMTTASSLIRQAVPNADPAVATILDAIDAWILTDALRLSLTCMTTLDACLIAATANEDWAATHATRAVSGLAYYGYGYSPSMLCDAVRYADQSIVLATAIAPDPIFAVQVRTAYPKPPVLPGTNL